MSFATLLPPVPDLLLEQVIFGEDCLTLVVRITTTTQMPCPNCGQFSRQVHGRARRTLCDLPVCGHRVRLSLQVRRFFCRTPPVHAGRFGNKCPPWLRNAHAGRSDSRPRCARSPSR